jgi:multidrug efflux pump subunit AcrA (membrane-fusion protein)
VLTAVTKDTIVTAVTGSGQVSTSDQVDLKPKVTGDILSYGLKAGQQVTNGQILVSINASNALKTVRDAQDSLTSAQLSLEKLQQAADPLTLLQAQNSLATAQEAKVKDVRDLVKSHDDGFNAVTNAYLVLPDIMSSLNDILDSSTINGSQSNVDAYADAAGRYDKGSDLYHQAAKDDYLAARKAFDDGFDAYKLANRTASDASIEALIDDTATVARSVSQAVKSASNLIQFYQDQLTLHGAKVSPISTTHLSTLDGETGTSNSTLSNLLSASRTIQDGKNALITDDRSIAERQGSLEKVQAPPDQISLLTAQLNVRQRQGSLDDARVALADYSIRSPFDGVVASVVNLKRGDAVSPSAVLGTVITKQPIAKLSLNEVDVAKVKVGQKATLTFDVVADLSITGNVIDVDTLGTTTQGVVNYGVKIAFDTNDDRIKPGMTVSASIITDAKTDVLAVPNSAIKSSNGGSYVEEIVGSKAADAGVPTGILAPDGTKRVIVVTGLASDTQTEIVSGLSEGDLIVSRTITATATGAASSNRSILQAAGAGGGGGFRTGGGNATFRTGN